MRRAVPIVGAVVSLSLIACSDGGPGPQTQKSGNYLIEMSAGHMHLFKQANVTFTVRNLDQCTSPSDTSTCAAVSGLSVTAFRRAPGSTAIREQAMEAGVLVDNGDGTYTWAREFNELGGHLIGLKFEKNGFPHFGAFVVETSRAGGERFFCTSVTPNRAYQIRWNASKGHLHADGDEVSFSIELVRSFNQTLNTQQPWLNSFDHLHPAEIVGEAPTVKLMMGEGAAATEVTTLPVTYLGRGMYEVKRSFSNADMGGSSERTFWLKVSFQDTLGCTVDSATAEEEYHFHVAAGH